MKICLAGYGLIGTAWAGHYQADGFELAVWNRTPKPEVPGYVEALTDAVRGADVLHIVVADPPAVAAVLEKALPALPQAALVVQSSTISPAWARRFADQVESGGRGYVEAPFTGSKPAAEARQNVFYLGGAPEAKARAECVLRRLSARCFDIGTVEQAAALKLAMNLQIASIAQALAESISLARSAGVSDEMFFEVLELNVAKSGVSALKRPKLLQADYSPQFSVKHMAKDLRLALETAAPGTAPLTRATSAIYEEGIRRSWGEEDFIGLVRLLQNAPDGSAKK